MNLAIFDIDGTLTRTNEVDGRCFQLATQEVLGIKDVNTDWGAYQHSTDSGIFDEIFKDRMGRDPEEGDIQEFKNAFVGFLEHEAKTKTDSFSCVPGASSIFASVLKNSNWKVSIATGAWKPSADVKLKATRLHDEKIPAAHAEDAYSRDDIVKISIARAKDSWKQSRFDKIVYLGDGRWDARTAARLKIGFVGIQDTRDRDLLHREGASHILSNYENLDSVLDALEACQTPKTNR